MVVSFWDVFLANFSLHDEALWIGFLHENQVRQFAGAEDVEHAVSIIKNHSFAAWTSMDDIIDCIVLSFWMRRFVLSGLDGLDFPVVCVCGAAWAVWISGIGQMGILGFPQVAAYAAAYSFLLVLMEAGKRVRQERRNAHLLQNKPDLKAQALLIVLFLLDTGIYGAGIWLEYWVNPWILLHTAVVG